METTSVVFATSDHVERDLFRQLVEDRQLPFKLFFPDTVFSVEASFRENEVGIIITDLRFQKGGFADWLFLWPSPFILLAGYADLDRIDAICKDESSSFLIRDPSHAHVALLPVMIRKVLNVRESMNRHNVHLQSSERRYLDLVQALPDLVYIVDGEGYFTFVNDSVRQLGWEPIDLIGKHFSSILHPEDSMRVSRRAVLQQYRGRQTGDEAAPKLFDERRSGDRKTKDLEVRLRRKAQGGDNIVGSVTSYGEISAVGFAVGSPTAGEPGSVGIIRDITHRKEMERLRTMSSPGA